MIIAYYFSQPVCMNKPSLFQTSLRSYLRIVHRKNVLLVSNPIVFTLKYCILSSNMLPVSPFKFAEIAFVIFKDNFQLLRFNIQGFPETMTL